MFQSLLLIAFIIAALWGLAQLKRHPPAVRRKLLLRSAIGALILMLFAMVISGRAHWLFALIGALIPFMRGMLGVGLQLLPLWLTRRRKAQKEQPHEDQHKHQSSPASPSDMAIKEAMDVLGLSGDPASGKISVETVNDAHRRLIQKLHPDRGGNDYLASKINQARDVLLKALE